MRPKRRRRRSGQRRRAANSLDAANRRTPPRLKSAGFARLTGWNGPEAKPRPTRESGGYVPCGGRFPSAPSADPARGSEFNVTQLCEMEGEKITTMSARLKVLSAARSVSRRRVGQTIVYTIADAHVLNLVDNAISHACEPTRPHPRTEPKEKISCRIISPTPNTPSSRPEVQPPRREARRPCRLHA